MTNLIDGLAEGPLLLLGNGTYPFGWSDTTWGYLAAFLALALFGSFCMTLFRTQSLHWPHFQLCR
jgi:hypothetical protein